MKRKIIGIFICMLLTATAITTIVSSKNSEIQQLMMPSVIDQQQPNTPEMHWLNAGAANWQQFTNRGKTIEKVELHIGCYASGSEPITLEIKETLTATPITQVTYNASALPLNIQAWFTFDVPDARLVQNKLYYIIVTFDPGSEYAWSGSHNNPYPNGTSSHPDADWDYAFRTIVDKKTSWETKTYEMGEFNVSGGFIGCGVRQADFSLSRPLTEGTNFFIGKGVTMSSQTIVCLGISGWNTANWFGNMPYGATFSGTLTIGKFYGTIIKLYNSTGYILAGFCFGGIKFVY